MLTPVWWIEDVQRGRKGPPTATKWCKKALERRSTFNSPYKGLERLNNFNSPYKGLERLSTFNSPYKGLERLSAFNSPYNGLERLSTFNSPYNGLERLSLSHVIIEVRAHPSGLAFSWQVPQFILEEAEMSGDGSVTRIIVTQPRRIAAMR